MIENIVNMLLDVDSRIGDVWVMPNAEDSLMFMITELGESYDALLRQKQGFFRNNDDKEVSFTKEIADIAMMAGKAYIGINGNAYSLNTKDIEKKCKNMIRESANDSFKYMYSLSMQCIESMKFFADGDFLYTARYLHCIIFLCNEIVSLHNENLMYLVTKKLQKTEEKVNARRKTIA